VRYFIAIFLFVFTWISLDSVEPRTHRILAWVAYMEVLSKNLSDKNPRFDQDIHLLFADLIKLKVVEKIAVYGSSAQMYPVLGAYYLRYFGRGKLYHRPFLEKEQEKNLVSQIQLYLKSYVLQKFVTQEKISPMETNIEIVVIDFSKQRGDFDAIYKECNPHLSKDALFWVHTQKGQILELEKYGLKKIEIYSFEEDFPVAVYSL